MCQGASYARSRIKSASQAGDRSPDDEAAFRRAPSRSLDQLHPEHGMPSLRKQDRQAGLQGPLYQMWLHVGLQRTLTRPRAYDETLQ